MKYIFNDKRTAETLSEWSGLMLVLAANFFFWKGGTHEQRSQVGLLRLLLFQISQHQPAIAALIFPDEFARFRGMSPNEIRRFTRQPWTLRHLQDALQRLIKLPDHPMKMCLFIDGLDEFEGCDERDDHLYLVELLKSLCASPFVKICISSRPLLVFEETFCDKPGLRLQDLTTVDIRRYASDKLSNNVRMQQLAIDEPVQREYFVDKTSEKA